MGFEALKANLGHVVPPMAVVDARPVAEGLRVVVPEDFLTRRGVDVGQPVVDALGGAGGLNSEEDDARAIIEFDFVVKLNVPFGPCSQYWVLPNS